MKRWPMCAAVAVAFVTACFGGAGSGGASSKSNAPTNAVPSPASGEPTAGDPVGLVSGSVYETAEDLRVSCPGVDLVMHRSYGSWSDRAGSLGVGWTHSYEWTVERSGDAVTVYVSGERGPSDVAREFAAPGPGGESLDADGYAIRLSPTDGSGPWSRPTRCPIRSIRRGVWRPCPRGTARRLPSGALRRRDPSSA